MNFAWQDFLRLAEEWGAMAAPRYPEALYRSLISRAYYAIFHESADLAQAMGLTITRSASDHYRLRQFFGERGRGRVAGQLAFILRTLYDMRASADYEIDPNDSVTNSTHLAARDALDLAHQAMQMIGYLRKK